jgi:hypothetical protein
MEKDIDKINESALEKVSLAQPILDKIRANPSLVNIQDISLSNLHDSRWNGHFILDTLDEIASLYNAYCLKDLSNVQGVPQEVKKFYGDAIDYKFFDKKK